METKPDLDGALIAYRYVRDCGATTGYATHIAIGRCGEPRKQATIVFIADGDEFGSGTGGDGARSEMRWIAPRQLSITYSEKARLFRREPTALEARVTYRPDR